MCEVVEEAGGGGDPRPPTRGTPALDAGLPVRPRQRSHLTRRRWFQSLTVKLASPGSRGLPAPTHPCPGPAEVDKRSEHQGALCPQFSGILALSRRYLELG